MKWACDKNELSACNSLAYHWAEKEENLDEAENLIKRALAEQPDNPYYLDTWGWILHKQGRDQEALTAVKRSLKESRGKGVKDDAVVIRHLTEIQAALGGSPETPQENRKTPQTERPEK